MLESEKPYRFLEIIGQGSFGKVYRSVDPQGTVVAVKVIDVEKDNIQDVLNEIELLRSLKHKNILGIFNAQVVDLSVWLCTEYCGGGSLHKLLRRERVFKERHAVFVLSQITQAIAHMHRFDIIHRDLKPANVFLQQDGNIKLGDFGVSAKLTHTSPGRETMIGTPFWMAPEVILQDYYGTPADVWAIGIMAIELVSGRTPHTGMNPIKAMRLIAQEDAPVLSRSVRGQERLLSEKYVCLVDKCLVREPTSRATADELCSLRLLNRYASPDREFRGMVSELIASHPQQSSNVPPCDQIQHDRPRDWDFGETLSRPVQILGSPSKIVKACSSPPQVPATKAGYSVEPFLPYLTYIDYALRLTEERALHAESKIRIGKLRMQLLHMEKTLNGFGRALLEEVYYLVEDQDQLGDLMNTALFRVQARSRKPAVNESLRLLRLNFAQLERDYSGVSKALSEEIRGRLAHFPYQL